MLKKKKQQNNKEGENSNTANATNAEQGSVMSEQPSILNRMKGKPDTREKEKAKRTIERERERRQSTQKKAKGVVTPGLCIL